MSFWSKLAKGLAIGGAGLGTVLTAGGASPLLGAALSVGGGVLSKVGNAAKVGGPLASGLAAGAQSGRTAENQAAKDAAEFKLRESGQHEGALMDRATLDLKRREDARVAQKNAYQLARQSALAKNMKDVTVSGVPTGPIPFGSIPHIQFNGGLRPSAYGAEGQAAAGEMNRQAMQSLMHPEAFNAVPDPERTAAPTFQKPGAGENILGGLGLGLNAINGFTQSKEDDAFKQKILAAIDALSNKSGPKITTPGLRTALGTATAPGLAGVTPFWKPPTSPLGGPYDPYNDSGG